MTVQDFIKKCDKAGIPPVLPAEWLPLLHALALDRCGDWDAAHSITQDIPDSQGSAVHAYLHRKEGVLWNAEYWYSRAGRPPFQGNLEAEWEALASELLV